MFCGSDDMKHSLSLKGKLTFTYTALMTVMVALVIIFLFYMSNRQSLQELRRRLEEEVTDEAGEISYDKDDGILEFDSDFMELENGVYLSAYSADGIFLYGRVPYDFDFYTGLIPGSTRKAEGGASSSLRLMCHTSCARRSWPFSSGVTSCLPHRNSPRKYAPDS